MDERDTPEHLKKALSDAIRATGEELGVAAIVRIAEVLKRVDDDAWNRALVAARNIAMQRRDEYIFNALQDLRTD